MEDRIRDYVENLFVNAPQTQKVYEMKVELIQNLIDKYHDLIEGGKSEEDAYNITVLGIGDINELLSEVEKQETTYMEKADYYKRRSALCITIAVMMYILSVVPVIVFAELHLSEVLGVAIMFVLIALATGLIIYNSMTKPKKNETPETVVDEFRQWQSGQSNSKNAYKALMSAYWPLMLAVYFIFSFLTGRWDVSWIIFLIAPAGSGIIKAIFELKNN